MDVIKIGKLIAQIRKEKKLTQEELGSKLGISGKLKIIQLIRVI